MSAPLESLDYWYWPIMPYWLSLRCRERFQAYPSQYQALAAKYADGSGTFYAGSNITLKTINDYLTMWLPSYGQIEGPFVSTTTSTGRFINFQTIPLTQPIPTPGTDDYYVIGAMVYGLMQWQMYAVMLAQTYQRCTFGYYGRKPKSGR